uniref:Uncharacterized protein n=1 Tax=Rhinolophus ferrumequinum TaxID=59479 RepID=A0A671DUT5_RHIFE
LKLLEKRMCTKQDKNKICLLEVRITQGEVAFMTHFSIIPHPKSHKLPLFPVSSIPPKTDPFKVRPEKNNQPLMLSWTPNFKSPTITQTPWLSWQEAKAAACCKAMQENAGVKKYT